ncbi:integrase, catalytic region, zinc finger, CCHC-type containing protein [Tanacetum coccineum]
MLTRVLRIILVIVPEHPSDTYVLIMKMEILLEPASNKLLVGDSLNLPDHRIHKDGDGDASFQLESDSLPHAHAQTTKTYYKHQDSRIMKAQELKTKTSAQTLIYKIFLQRYQVYQGRLLASFQDDAKYEHNDSFAFVHELKQEMHADLKYIESLDDEIDELEFIMQNFPTCMICFCKNLWSKDNKPQCSRIPKPSVLGKPAPFSDSLERTNFAKKKSVSKTNESEGLSKPVTPQNLPQTATQAVSNINVIKPGMYRIASSTTQTRAPQLTQTSRNTNPRISTSIRVAHKMNVSRPQLRSNQIKDKVVPNTSHVKFKKTKVEEHPRISSISNQTKSVTACNDSLNSRTLNVNAVCATCGKCVFNSNHDACVSKFLNDVNARTKKPKVVPISTRKPKSQANKSVATYRKKTVASESTITNSKSYYRMLYEKTNKAWKWWIEQQCPSGYKWVPKTKKKWVPKVRNENLQKRVSFAIDNASRITNIVQLILLIVDSGCTKHMTASIILLWAILFSKNIRRIEHQTSIPRTPEQNGVVERRNRTLVEAARTMLSASKLPLFFWAKAIATASFPNTKASDYENPNPAPELQNVSPSTDTTVPSQQELNLLFGPLYDEFFNDGTSRVNKSSSPTNNSIQKDTLPSTHIQPTSELTTPTNVHAEENNDNQA